MSNINPNCDGSHCRHGYKEVRKYPSSGGDYLYLCLPCFANENMHMQRAKETCGDEDCPQVNWSTAEVVYDKHGQPFDAEAAMRRGSSTIIKTATATVTRKSVALYRGITLHMQLRHRRDRFGGRAVYWPRGIPKSREPPPFDGSTTKCA